MPPKRCQSPSYRALRKQREEAQSKDRAKSKRYYENITDEQKEAKRTRNRQWRQRDRVEKKRVYQEKEKEHEEQEHQKRKLDMEVRDQQNLEQTGMSLRH